jgi:hypothetical protein
MKKYKKKFQCCYTLIFENREDYHCHTFFSTSHFTAEKYVARKADPDAVIQWHSIQEISKPK